MFNIMGFFAVVIGTYSPIESSFIYTNMCLWWAENFLIGGYVRGKCSTGLAIRSTKFTEKS